MPADPPKFKITKEITREDIFFRIARVPSTQQVFLGSSNGSIYFVDCAQEKLAPVAFPAHKSYVTGLALGGEALVSGGYDGQLIWWNSTTREQIRKIKGHDRWIRDVKASPDGKMIASVGDDMVCKLWDAESGKLKHELHGHNALTPTQFNSMLYTCAFSADGKLLATADRVGHIVIWDVASAKSVGSVEAPALYTWDGKQRIRSIGGVRALAFSPDSKLLAAGGIDQVGNVDGLSAKARVDTFEWRENKHLGGVQCGKNGMIECLQFHPNNEWLLAAGGEGKGVLAFLNPVEKKILDEAEAPMYIHRFVWEDKLLFAAGHKKFAIFEETVAVKPAKPEPAKPEKAS